MAGNGTWKCKMCKVETPDEEDHCDSCFAPRASATAPRQTCRTCCHRHSTGKYCHVFVVNNKRRKRKAAKWNRARNPAKEDETDGDPFSSETSSDYSLQERDGNEKGAEGGEEEEEDKGEEEEGEEGEEGEEEEQEDSSEDSSESSDSEGADGPPKTAKKGLLGLGDRLAAKAAAIAKTTENALQMMAGVGRQLETPQWARSACFRRCNCGHGVPTDSTAFVRLQEGRTLQHEAVGAVTVRTEPPEGAELEFENRPPLAQTPPPPRALRLFLEFMDSRTVACCARTSTEWHRECYETSEEGLPMHPTYTGIHFIELDSLVDACQDKIDGMFFHQPPTGSFGQLFTSGQRKVTVWRREEVEVPKVRHDLVLHAKEPKTLHIKN